MAGIGIALLLDMCCGPGTRKRAPSSCAAADVAMETNLEQGESSSRVRQQTRQEIANEHPEVEGRVLEDAFKASGLDKSSDTQKQAELNLTRTGRYKKKHFV